MCAHVLVWVCIEVRGQPSGAVQLLFCFVSRQGLTLAWNSPRKLGWLARELQGCSCLCLPSTGLQVCITMPDFLEELKVSCLQFENFINCSTFWSFEFYLLVFALLGLWPMAHQAWTLPLSPRPIPFVLPFNTWDQLYIPVSMHRVFFWWQYLVSLNFSLDA